jgi:hypothetical protein
VASALALALALTAAPSRGLASDNDGFYDRFNGDLVLTLEANSGLLESPAGLRPYVSVAARTRYLGMIGLCLAYDRALSGPRTDALWLATDFRPFMAARINFDMQHGPRWLDLTLDSIGLDLGVAWLRPGEPLRRGGGLGLVLGTGVELPLAWRDGRAVLLRLEGRWISSHPWVPQGTGREEYLWEAGVGIVVRTMAIARVYGRHD